MTSLACCGGFIDSGIPTGKVESINGINCYVAQPSTPTTYCVIVATDIFGYTLVNARLIADSFAKQGFYAVVPDLFQGSEPPSELLPVMELLQNGSAFERIKAASQVMYYLPGFLLRNSYPKSVNTVKTVIEELRKTYTKFGVQGYCWGGKVAALLAQEQGTIDAAIAAHAGGLKIPQDIEALVSPTFFVIAEIDFAMTAQQASTITQVLESKGKNFKAKTYPKVTHGFAVRGNENDEHVKKQRETAFADGVEFFKKHL